MEQDVLDIIKEYKENHPEFDEIMNTFQASQELYEKALSFMYTSSRKSYPTAILSTGGMFYNVNVSQST